MYRYIIYWVKINSVILEHHAKLQRRAIIANCAGVTDVPTQEYLTDLYTTFFSLKWLHIDYHLDDNSKYTFVG